MNLDLLNVILPQDFLLHFDIVNFKELGDVSIKKDCLHLYLEEKNNLPKGYSKSDYESKGFISSKQVQDFPIRGKAVYLEHSFLLGCSVGVKVCGMVICTLNFNDL